jgi:hypothetical protein
MSHGNRFPCEPKHRNVIFCIAKGDHLCRLNAKVIACLRQRNALVSTFRGDGDDSPAAWADGIKNVNQILEPLLVEFANYLNGTNALNGCNTGELS